MRTKLLLLSACFSLPAISVAANGEGWSASVKSEVVSGCVSSLKDTVVADARRQLGLKGAEPLPDETSKTLESKFMPEFRKACTCTIDRVAQKHSYQEVQKDPSILKREAERVGTPEGCPLNV